MKNQLKGILINLGLDGENTSRLLELYLDKAENNEKNKLFSSSKTQTLLNLLISATFDLQKFEKEALLLQDYILANEKDLSIYDRSRFLHIRGYISWRIYNSIFFAYEYLNRSLKALLRLGTKEATCYMARVYDTYGQILRTQGLLKDARLEFEKALALREGSEDTIGKALTLGNLGRLNLEMGNYKKAKEYLSEDLEIVSSEIKNNNSIQAQLLNTIAICSVELKQYQEAEDSLRKSCHLNSIGNNKTGLCFNHLAFSNLFIAKGDIAKSQKHIENAKSLLEEQGFPQFLKNDIEGDLYRMLAEIYHLNESNDDSIENYKLALKFHESSSSVSPISKAKLLRGYAKVLRLCGFDIEANNRYREALRYIDLSEDELCRKEISEELKAQNKDSWLLHTAGRFIGHKQIDLLLNEAGNEGFRGESKNAVILFSDIRDFTSFSEKLSPGDLISFLNDFFGLMTKCIESNNGFVDKFIGDEIMAIFAVNDDNPETIQKAAEDASIAALMMLNELDRINRKLPSNISKLKMGTGLHYGQVVAGLIGSPQKRSYTFMGDVVNTASRIEGMAKQLGANILVTKEVYSNYSNKIKFLIRPLGKYQPKGKELPLIVADLMGIDDGSVDMLPVKAEINEVKKYLELFHNRNFKKAINGFDIMYQKYSNAAKSKAYVFLSDKSKSFLAEPPSRKWNGEIKLKSK